MQQITHYLNRLTYKVFPNLVNQSEAYQKQVIPTMTLTFLLAPFLILGTVWLIWITDWGLLTDHWVIFLLLLLLTLVMDRQQYVLPIKLTKDFMVPVTTSLSSIIGVATIFIFGPTVIWLFWLNGLLISLYLIWQDSRYQDRNPYIMSLNNLVQSSGTGVFISLLAAAVYSSSGGQFPFNPDGFADWVPAILSVLTFSIAPIFVYFFAIASIIFMVGIPLTTKTFLQMGGGSTVTILLSVPFAMPLAMTYNPNNLTLFIFLSIGIGFVNLLAYYLSQFNLLTEIRTRELSTLESISEALIAAPADASTLESILTNHLPQLFPNSHLTITIFPPKNDQAVPPWPIFSLQIPNTAGSVLPDVWPRLQQAEEPYLVDRKVIRPGDRASYGDRFLVKILVTAEDGNTNCVGGIYLQRQPSSRKPNQVLPTLQELANQIGSALFRAKTHRETLKQQKMAQELAFAGRIQQSFLPNEIPQHPNWDFAATLIPARQTSGDFYDFVPLGDGRLGLVVADVADKGTGAALYMALSRTLIRTYAMQFPDEPGKALELANERILTDTESDQFVTVFYGVLDLANGRFTYANAGHNPTFHIGNEVRSLTKTGIPLGMFGEMAWTEETVQIDVGDCLILYSDGVPEAQNSQQEEFGEDRMLTIAQQAANGNATAQQTAIASAVNHFVDGAPQFDDITLMIVTRLN